MKSSIHLDIKRTGQLKRILEPGLETDQTVEYSIEAVQGLQIEIETESIGPLRGATDTAFRLAMLADRIRSR